MKKLALLVAVVTLSAGAVFAQPVRDNDFRGQPQISDFPGQAQNDIKLLGIVDSTSQNSITFIDMDGKKVTVLLTPFTEIQDVERLQRLDPKAKDARDQYFKTFLSINQLNKGHWVDIKGFRTDGGKLVADYVKVIRVQNNNEK